jgi:hypothetical protein
MSDRNKRVVRVQIERTSFDFVLAANSDTGVAKVSGLAVMEDLAGLHDLGHVEVTIWGSTVEQLRVRARTWPERFNGIPEDYFGVSSDEEHRFDIFISATRFINVVNLLNAAHGGQIVIHADASEDGKLDYVSQVEISAARA